MNKLFGNQRVTISAIKQHYQDFHKRSTEKIVCHTCTDNLDSAINYSNTFGIALNTTETYAPQKAIWITEVKKSEKKNMTRPVASIALRR